MKTFLNVLLIYIDSLFPFIKHGWKSTLKASLLYFGFYPLLAIGMGLILIISLTACTAWVNPLGTGDFSVLPELKPPLGITTDKNPCSY